MRVVGEEASMLAGQRARWLVIGSAGQLGTDLVRTLIDEDVTGMDVDEIDITDPVSVTAAFNKVCPTVVVNAAAYTAVDAAESDEESAWAVNAEGPGLLAGACFEAGATLVHISTDYVFAGDAETPFEVTAPTGPINVYGQTKLAGEEQVRNMLAEHYVVRTAWLYSDAGTNFVKTIARLERERTTIDVINDQHGTPTWSADLAQGLVTMVRCAVPFGTYHCTNAGTTTWYGLAAAIFAELGADPDRVRPCSTAQFSRPALRPRYSVLSDRAWRSVGLPPLRPWRDALAAAFAKHGAVLRQA